MTREILFRGKRMDNGEWVKGFPYITHGGEHQIRYYDSESNIENCSHTVIPDTLGRFTGLTDRNGVKIFEGDIIKYSANKVGIINYETGCFCTQDIKSRNNPALDTVFASFLNIEIIGNIHDNPELLEVSGND